MHETWCFTKQIIFCYSFYVDYNRDFLVYERLLKRFLHNLTQTSILQIYMFTKTYFSRTLGSNPYNHHQYFRIKRLYSWKSECDSKGRFAHNPLPLFLHFLPNPSSITWKKNKIYFHLTLKGSVIFFVELIIRIATPGCTRGRKTQALHPEIQGYDNVNYTLRNT